MNIDVIQVAIIYLLTMWRRGWGLWRGGDNNKPLYLSPGPLYNLQRNWGCIYWKKRGLEKV